MNEIELNSIEEQIIELLNKCNLVGMNVIHKKYGKGKIIEQNNNKIDVKFENDERKTLQIPFVFINNIISCSDDEIVNQMKKIDELLIQKNEIEKEIKQKEYEQKLSSSVDKNVVENKTMLVVTTGTSFEDDIKTNIYYCKSEKIKEQCEYIGLYKDKSVRAIGKIKKVIEATKIKGKLNVKLFYGEPITEEDKKKIEDCINKSITLFGCDIGARSHKYFIVDKFIETDYQKKSANGIMQNKYFDLYKRLEVKELPSVEEIAEKLKDIEW